MIGVAKGRFSLYWLRPGGSFPARSDTIRLWFTSLASSGFVGASHLLGRIAWGRRQAGGGTNSTLIVQLCCQRTECGNQRLGWKPPEDTPQLLRTRCTSLHYYFRNAADGAAIVM